jgi:putative PIN family toxin of toxin-antitoxin system
VSAGVLPRLVLDTNVLLDLWVFDDPQVASLRAALEAGSLRALRSEDCDAEFDEVIARPQFGLDEAARHHLLARWSACSEPIARVSPAPLTCSDPDDQKFLDAAFSARADLLLTRDKALLRLARRAEAAGVRIRSPAAAMTYDRSGT